MGNLNVMASYDSCFTLQNMYKKLTMDLFIHLCSAPFNNCTSITGVFKGTKGRLCLMCSLTHRIYAANIPSLISGTAFWLVPILSQELPTRGEKTVGSFHG